MKFTSDNLVTAIHGLFMIFYGSTIGVAVGITITGDLPLSQCLFIGAIVFACASIHIELVTRIIFRRGI